jgi:hypothetical protein
VKIVLNRCWGGYSLSEAACTELDIEWDGYGYFLDDDRSNAKLVEVVEKLGEKADGCSASLKVVEIPDDVEWHIEEYDGMEHVAENHRTWK